MCNVVFFGKYIICLKSFTGNVISSDGIRDNDFESNVYVKRSKVNMKQWSAFVDALGQPNGYDTYFL